MKTLYKKTKTGAIQQWQIIVSENRFKTIEGQVDGKLTESEWTVCKAKNGGKLNATSGEEQAIKEAEAKYKKKLESGYYENIEDIDKGKSYFECMLAHKIEDYPITDFSEPIYSQPKLDGIRCIISKDGMFTRTGKEIVSCPHIFTNLDLQYHLRNGVIYDGELYNHEYKNDFNELVSIIKKVKPTQEDIDKAARVVQYHIYDVFFENNTDTLFSDRMIWYFDEYSNLQQPNIIKKIFNITFDNFVNVKTTLISSKEQMDELFAQYVQDGYEGQMLRHNTPYKHGRSKHLLKRKDFLDEEFEILDILEGEGNRSGMAGKILIITNDGVKVETGIRGNFNFYKDLLDNRLSYIGQKATVRFQNYTPAGSLRFPVTVAIRNYE
jgi:DNA ligase-1